MTTYFSETYPAAAPSFGGDQTWVQAAGSWVNQGGGRATVTLGGSSAFARANNTAPSADMSVTVTANAVPSGRSLGVVARSNNATTIGGLTGYVADFHFDSSTCYLFYVVAGVSTPIANITVSAPTYPATLTLSVYGTNVRVYLNGSQIGSYTDSHVTTGNYGGLWVYNSSGDVSFSNFAVSSALQATGVVSGSATLSQGSSLATAPTYGAVASATLSQDSSITAQAGYTAVVGQGSSLSVTGQRIAVTSPSLGQPVTLSAVGFTYWFAESFRAVPPNFGGDVTWNPLAQTWVNTSAGEGTCDAQGVVGAVLANRDAPGADMAVRVTLGNLGTDRSVGLIARANSVATSLANLNAYVFDIHGDNGGQYYLLSVVNGTVSVIDGPVLMPITAGDNITLSVLGTGITLLHNGFSVATYTNAAVTSGTRAGIWSYNGNGDVAFSNFTVGSAFNQALAYPTGIASTLAMGAPSRTSGSVGVSPTGIGTSTVLGQPVMSGSTGVHPTGIVSTSALGTPTAHATVVVSPAGIASTLAVGSPTASLVINAYPSGVASTLSVGTPVAHATANLDPTGIGSTLALGTPVASPGPAPVHPTGVSSTLAAGTPTAHSTVAVRLTGIASALGVGSPRMSGTLHVSPSGVAGNNQVGTPSVHATTGVGPTGVYSTLSAGRPTAKHRDYVVLTGIASTVVLGSPRVHAVLNVRPTGIASTSILGTPSAKRVRNVVPAGIASTLAVGSPHAGGTVTVTPRGIPSGIQTGKPSAAPGVLHASPAGIPTGSAVGSPTVAYRPAVNPPWNRIRRMSPVHRIMDE